MQRTIVSPPGLGVTEHELSYAYPTSPAACKHGFARTGCFLLRIGKQVRSFATKVEAIAHIQANCTIPSRWSMDNPLNAQR